MLHINMSSYFSVLLRERPAIHCGLKVASSQAKLDKNFANFFLKTKAKNKCFIVLNCTYKGLQKSIRELERGKIKAQGVATLKSRPCLKN